jgi:AcrR family transcriptional regulator
MSTPKALGRPRNPAIRAAVLDAARALLAEDGLPAVTIEALAARAGVSRPTIYRYWPNAAAVAMEAFVASTLPPGPSKSTGSPLTDLAAHLRKLAHAFATPTGRSAAALLAASQGETELTKAFRHHFIMTARQEGRRLLTLAASQGQLRPRLDLELTLDLIYGPLYFRLLMGHAELSKSFTDRLLQLALAGLSPRPASPSSLG